ncbi:MAG: protease inhibitor I42 family protein, partial [Oscillospiraceae bacterium]|nr:protease inhibitor I42 family protein [Oscillospiraceae bacterium]
MRKILILGMTLMLIMGCNTNQLLPNIQDTPEIISINLEENPTTGYLWSYTAEPADILKEVGCEFKEPQSNGLVGTSGVRIFTFEPIKDGEVTVTFNYSRSWETKAPVKVCTVSYSVTDGKATVMKELEEKDPTPALTEETAEKFILEVLSTLTVHENDTATFTLPENIPADTEGDTTLMITMNVKSVVEAGVYSSKRFLDNETSWSGGEIFVADLKECEGRADQIMLRVAFMTKVEENAYREYKADHVYLTAPFEYGKPALPNEGLSFTQTFGNLHAIYTTAEGREFEFNLYLPDEIEAKSSDGENEILLMKNGEEIGALAPVMYAATDAETLEAVRESAEPRPMAVYSSAILSNTVEWPPVDSSEIYHTGKTITTVNHPMVDDEIIFDCVLAYNIDSEPYFVYLNFKAGALTTEEIGTIAGSIVLPPKGGLYSIAAEGIGDEFAPGQSQMPTEHGWAGEAERKYYQNIIDTLDFSKLNTFVAQNVPSDDITSAELTYEQTKTFFDLL